MKIEDDPFADLEKLRLCPEHYQASNSGAGEKWATVPFKVRRRRQHFVKVPWTWVERLKEARHIVTYRVALLILYQHWENGGKPFTLSNSAAALVGAGRSTKWRALRELEHLGLIAIGRRKRKSPLITVITAVENSK
jgi:hypothetical protein